MQDFIGYRNELKKHVFNIFHDSEDVTESEEGLSDHVSNILRSLSFVVSVLCCWFDCVLGKHVFKTFWRHCSILFSVSRMS